MNYALDVMHFNNSVICWVIEICVIDGQMPIWKLKPLQSILIGSDNSPTTTKKRKQHKQTDHKCAEAFDWWM